MRWGGGEEEEEQEKKKEEEEKLEEEEEEGVTAAFTWSPLWATCWISENISAQKARKSPTQTTGAGIPCPCQA